MDIIKIKAEVYQLEQQGKRLPILHYLQDVWQQEPPSEGLTVLALRQMVAYADTVVQFSENSPLWRRKMSIRSTRLFCWILFLGG